MNPLISTKDKHSKDNLAAIKYIYIDLDVKDIEETAEDVEAQLRCLPLRPTWIARSGHGWHVVWELREPIDRDVAEFDWVLELQDKIVEWLCADRSVRPWTVMRLPGTTNYKREPYVPCEEIFRGEPVDLTEIAWLVDTIGDRQLFTRKEEPGRAPVVHDQEFDPGYKEPLDVDQRLADMTYEGPGDAAIHKTQVQVTASLIGRGYTLDAAVAHVLAETEKRAPANTGNGSTSRSSAMGGSRSTPNSRTRCRMICAINSRRSTAPVRPLSSSLSMAAGSVNGPTGQSSGCVSSGEQSTRLPRTGPRLRALTPRPHVLDASSWSRSRNLSPDPNPSTSLTS
jgi:hypothetical protein